MILPYIVCIPVAVLCWIAGLIYEYYYLHERKKPKVFLDLTRNGKFFWGMTILQLGIGIFILIMSLRSPEMFWVYVEHQILLHVLLVIAVIDYRVRKIPNPLVLGMLAVWVIGFLLLHTTAWSFEQLKGDFLYALWGFLTGGLISLICRLVSRGGMGSGDVKLLAVLGLFFGLIGTLNILFYACLIAAIICGVLLITRQLHFKDSVPMAPFVFLAVICYDVLVF